MTPPRTGPDLGTLGHIPVTRLRVLLEPARTWTAPPHAGDLLRRALVSALYAVTPQRRQAAILEDWFDPRGGRARERPYALVAHIPDAPGPGAPVRLQLTLVGLVPDPPLVLEALQAMALKGLGDERVPHTITALEAWGATHQIFDPAAATGWPVPARLSDLLQFPPAPPRRARVHLMTPLSPGAWRDLADRPEALAVAPLLLFETALHRARRLQSMLGLRQRARFAAPCARVTEVALRWNEVQVQAVRKRRPDHLSGVTGTLEMEGHLAGLVPLLAVAEVLQLGRATTRGHGVVAVEWGEPAE